MFYCHKAAGGRSANPRARRHQGAFPWWERTLSSRGVLSGQAVLGATWKAPRALAVGSGEGRTLVESQEAGRLLLHEQRLFHGTVPFSSARTSGSFHVTAFPRMPFRLGQTFTHFHGRWPPSPFTHVLLYVINSDVTAGSKLADLGLSPRPPPPELVARIRRPRPAHCVCRSTS